MGIGTRHVHNESDRRKTGLLQERSNPLQCVLLLSALVFVSFGARSLRGQGVGRSFAGMTSSPAFAVCSIRGNNKHDGRWKMVFTPDGYTAYGVTLRMLIQDAFGMYDPDRITGFPEWAGNDRFDVLAKVDESDVTAYHEMSRDERRLLLQELLYKRFMLAAHYEKRETSTYALVIDKGGPRVKGTANVSAQAGADAKGSITRSRPGQLTERGTTMSQFADFLGLQLRRPVIDKTGLSGRYDIQLDWTPDEMQARESGAELEDASKPSLTTALKEQLGLRLDAQRGTIDVLVVDHLQRPSEN